MHALKRSALNYAHKNGKRAGWLRVHWVLQVGIEKMLKVCTALGLSLRVCWGQSEGAGQQADEAGL